MPYYACSNGHGFPVPQSSCPVCGHSTRKRYTEEEEKAFEEERKRKEIFKAISRLNESLEVIACHEIGTHDVYEYQKFVKECQKNVVSRKVEPPEVDNNDKSAVYVTSTILSAVFFFIMFSAGDSDGPNRLFMALFAVSAVVAYVVKSSDDSRKERNRSIMEAHSMMVERMNDKVLKNPGMVSKNELDREVELRISDLIRQAKSDSLTAGLNYNKFLSSFKEARMSRVRGGAK